MRSANGGPRRRGPRAALAAAAMAALLGASIGHSAAQDQTPVIPAPPAEAEGATAEASAAAPSAEVESGAPHVQTVAQGVVAIDDAVVWRVRLVELSAEGTAAETAGFAFHLQRGGASILRNDATDRRVRLEPGEAAFVGAEDDADQTAVGSEPSSAWVLELVAPNASVGEGLGAGTVLFTSDIVEDYPAGTVEAELRRGVLLGNEMADIPAGTGPALLMVTSGRVQATPEGGSAETIDAGVGRLESGGLALRNPDAEPAVFVVAALGEVLEAIEEPAEARQDAEQGSAEETTAGAEAPTVDRAAGDDDDQAAAKAEQSAASEEDAEPAGNAATAGEAPVATGTDTDGDGLGDEDEAVYGSDPLNADYDADGLADGAEVNQYNSDPLNNDSDGDTLIDGEEVNQYGSNPASTDGDGDGLTDNDELFTYGTGPASFDTDGDGTGDGEEVINFGTDPTDSSSTP